MRFNTLSQWLSWQETCHPSEVDLGLERVLTVYQRLTTKPVAKTVISVAGTNGKGSSICFMESILRSAGYSVASYTSPHLFHYNERININGIAVSDQTLCEVFDRIDQARADISITYFEFGTLAALLLIAEQNLDIAILEVGLGGRLDAVNIIDADLALITAIDVDHEAWLGNDKELIAIEKAGIMRNQKPVICSDACAPKSIAASANKINAYLYNLDSEFKYNINDLSWDWHGQSQVRYSLPFLPIKGKHQYNNIAGVLMVLELLNQEYPVTQNQLREGILSSSIHGRLENIPGKITTIVDVAHNPQSTRALAAYLSENVCSGKVRIVTAMMADKNIPAMVKELTNKCTAWYVTDLINERAISANSLINIINKVDIESHCFAHTTAQQAYQHAIDDSQENDQIVIFGSFYLIHELQGELFRTRELS
ncbi:Dihydrofolate synthase @ Folylpolyglutamate synthase [hydrothermal vent metagenome]|uniref:Dihydrofolate synthase @ Folylpolyglutamate synthase n=1 Tax=hydrothermal vent metagenome TaxID=652676 RepID=A0A3B1A010_9ZZZZ